MIQGIPRFPFVRNFASTLIPMAKIWQTEEGQPLGGAPVAEKPLDWCIEKLGLRRVSRLANPSETVVIGANRRRLFGGPRRFVVVGIDEEETKSHSKEGWRSGYYLVLISVDGLKNKLSDKRRSGGMTH
jgi:hypothetical protein